MIAGRDMERCILHSDYNGFFAAVECMMDPSLQGKPVAVAGDNEARHGIILAKNAIAKKYGIKTGEAIWQAQKKCPFLTLVSPHYDLYMDFSRKAFSIYNSYKPRV